MAYALVINELAIRSIAADPRMLEALRNDAEQIATEAAVLAPKKTGAGAASIHAESSFDRDEWIERIGWDAAHYYMVFHERGTRYDPAMHFLQLALDRHAHMGR